MATKKKNNKAKSKNHNIKNFNYTGKYFVLTLVFAATASLLLVPTFAARGGKSNKKQGVGVYLIADKNSVKNGDTVTVQVWTKSETFPVNAVQAEITYPTSKFEVVDVSSAGTAYSIEAEQVASNGLVKMIRAANPAISGDNKVGTITFRAVDGNGKVNVNAVSSQLLSATTNENIATGNGSLSIRLSR